MQIRPILIKDYNPIRTITIEGYKSIRKLERFELRPLSVLIGANGAGKSNFIGFFQFLRELIEQRLQLHVQKREGGADGCLFMGPKVTQAISAFVDFGRNAYGFGLEPALDNQFRFARETTFFDGRKSWNYGGGHAEAKVKADDRPGSRGHKSVANYVYRAMSRWTVYHFHDTSNTAPVRRECGVHDNEQLHPDAGNLAAYLLRIRTTHPAAYSLIRDTIRRAAPFFDDFALRVNPLAPERISLEWRQRDSEYMLRPHQLSDGTLRFACLATAILQPDAPEVMLFDEPELGQHPAALHLLGNLFKAAAGDRRQLIVSTQSSNLIEEFDPEDIIVVEREGGESKFRRLVAADLAEWLGDYSLGELWRKGVLGAQPKKDGIPIFA